MNRNEIRTRYMHVQYMHASYVKLTLQALQDENVHLTDAIEHHKSTIAMLKSLLCEEQLNRIAGDSEVGT